MKILLDSCISNKVRSQLEVAGHDVIWAGDKPDPGDEALLKLAHAEGRVLVTLDKDFGKLAVLKHLPHCGIIRLVNLNLQEQVMSCLQALLDHGEDLSAGAIITAHRNRMRKRTSKR